MEQIPAEMAGYDRAITLFSPEGHLLQVEYARKTVQEGSAAVGLVGKDSVVFVADKKLPELQKLIVPESVEKIFKVDEQIGTAMAGMIADGRALIDKSQLEAQKYRMTYNEAPDITLLIKTLSSEMQTFTQYGGARPYGVSLLIGGINNEEPSLFLIEPSGIFFKYKAVAIGENSQGVNKHLEDGYKDGMDTDSMIKLAAKSLKTEGIKLNAERFEIAVVDASGFRKLSKEETAKYL